MYVSTADDHVPIALWSASLTAIGNVAAREER